MKKKHSILLIISLFLFLSSNILNAQIYSFEDGLVPVGWSTTYGSLQVTGSKYKLGSKSLCWTWSANSKMIISNPTGLSTASTKSSGGINIWVYNTLPTTSKLVFSFQNSSGQTKCHIDFKLYFKGWRCMIAAFTPDMGHDKSTLTTMSVQAPSSGSGTFYIDYLEFQPTVTWTRNSDAQYTVSQTTDESVSDFFGVRAYGNINATVSPTLSQINAVDTIIKRLDNWYLGTNKYANYSEYIIRKNSINNTAIKLAKNYYAANINLINDTDGTVTGPGLFQEFNSNTIDNINIKRFKDIFESGGLIFLAEDFRLNNTTLSKTRLLNVYDWFYDQGWADGSTIGSLRFEKLRICGYVHSLFLMRNELGTTRLERELNTLNMQSLMGNTFMSFQQTGELADNIRCLAMAKLFCAVMQSDPNKRVAALIKLTDYFNNAFSIAPGFLDTFKPDFSGYHHRGTYFGAYYPEALYTATLIYYLLHDTPYALSDSVYSVLKNSLLVYRLTASDYDVPVTTCGRFPTNTKVLDDIVPAFAYLALSRNQPDIDLLAAFGRLWKPSISPMKEIISRAVTDMSHKRTLGEIELCLQAATLAVPAENNPKTSFFLPYSGLMVNRNTTRLVSIKGFSKYIWDYESDLSDNLYGRYMSYGQIEFTSLPIKRKNNNYTNVAWDWNRLPGTTTEYLTSSQLQYTSSTPYRNFTDDPFLGGLALNDSTSMFSMKLHDNVFDPSFYANKSAFCFGNVMVCMGTNITNNSSAIRTETTLLQQIAKNGESFKVNGSLLSTSLSNLVQPVIQDNLGNRFIVKTGTVNIIKTDSMVTAVINHGNAPQNQSYTYFTLLQSNDTQETKYKNNSTCPVEIVRQDNVAHIVKNTDDHVWGYAIFNNLTALNDTWIQQVNTPSVLMFEAIDSVTYRLVVSDPDMHRPTTTDADAITSAIEVSPATAFSYQVILNGQFTLEGTYPEITLQNIANTTKITINAIDGKSYTIGLKLLTTPVNTVKDDRSFQCYETQIRNVYTVLSSDEQSFNVILTSMEGKLIKSISKLHSPYILDLQSCKKGIYIISIHNNTNMLNKKLIIV